MIYYFGGINGSGKTTLLAKIAASGQFRVVHLTSALMQFMGFTSYEELRKSPQGYNRKMLSRLIPKLLDEYKNQDVILDAHYLSLRHGRVSRVVDEWIKRVDALILLVADPAEIIRRIDQQARERGLFSASLGNAARIQKLQNYQELTKAEFSKLALAYNLPKKLIPKF